MQLIPLIAAAFMLAAAAAPAAAQSLSPMHNSGPTPSDVKGFRLNIGNPYRTAMTFLVLPMDQKFRVRAAQAQVNFPEVTLAPNGSRQVIVTFKIDPTRKERTIGVCVQPKDLESTVLPRVCGTYTGRMAGTGR
jgi:hypothetical protein